LSKLVTDAAVRYCQQNPAQNNQANIDVIIIDEKTRVTSTLEPPTNFTGFK